MEIEYAILADYAEVSGGKLYLMGGGWDTYGAAEAPASLRMAVVLGVRIGWEETNQPTPVRIWIDDDDAQEILRMDGSLTTGRPPNLPPGSTQLSQLAANLPVTLPRFGGFRVNIAVGTEPNAVERRIPFRLERRGP